MVFIPTTSEHCFVAPTTTVGSIVGVRLSTVDSLRRIVETILPPSLFRRSFTTFLFLDSFTISAPFRNNKECTQLQLKVIIIQANRLIANQQNFNLREYFRHAARKLKGFEWFFGYGKIKGCAKTKGRLIFDAEVLRIYWPFLTQHLIPEFLMRIFRKRKCDPAVYNMTIFEQLQILRMRGPSSRHVSRSEVHKKGFPRINFWDPFGN